MKTGVYIPLFWCDRFPQYEEWAHELLEQIKGSADVILVVTDNTLSKKLPDHVEEVHWHANGSPLLRACFKCAVTEFESRGVGAFYYIGADNLHEPAEIKRLLRHCTNGADVAFSAFDDTWERYDGVTFPPKAKYDLRFSIDAHSWPDSACFRTDLFTERPLNEDPREFIRKSLKSLHEETGREIVAVYDHTVGFFYFQHNSDRLDRSFIQGD